jgi:hypothetical protein
MLPRPHIFPLRYGVARLVPQLAYIEEAAALPPPS